MAPPMASPSSRYSQAVVKADNLLEDGLIDPSQFRDIVAADAQFHIEAARSERDEAVARLEARLEEVSLRIPSGDGRREIDLAASSDDHARPHDVDLDIVSPRDSAVGPRHDRLTAIVEAERGSESSGSSSLGGGARVVTPDVEAAAPALERPSSRRRHELDPDMPVAKRIGGTADGAERRKKGGLVTRLARGLSRRFSATKKKPKAGKDWEIAAEQRSRRSSAPAPAAAPPTTPRAPKPPPRVRTSTKKGRISEQPFSPADFERLRQIGRGGFGVVYLVSKRAAPDAGAAFAMKVLDKTVVLRGGGRAQAKLERDVLRVIRHAFVARLRYAFQTESRLYLLTDFYAGGSLSHFLRDLARYDPDCGRGEKLVLGVGAAAFYVEELAVALSYLHGKGVVHRDVKPSNVLVDRAGHVALCDFGIAAVCAEALGDESETPDAPRTPAPTRKSFCGTVEYMAPELLRGESYSFAVDWWALGILFYELLAGETPFAHKRPRELFANILRNEPPPLKESTSENAVAAVNGLLHKDAALRLGTSSSLKDAALFAGTDWDAVERKERTPPYAPTLPPYFTFDDDGTLKCSQKSALPKLDDDGESDDSEDERAMARKTHGGTARADAFKGFAYAGEDKTPHGVK